MGLDIPVHDSASVTLDDEALALQFPFLPEDVERLIIETTAGFSLQTALRLVCVCRLYRRWLYPIIYRAATIKSTSKAQQFSSTLSCISSILPLPPLGLAHRVQVLNFSNDVDTSMVSNVIPLCPNVVSIAYWKVRSKILPRPLIDLSTCSSLRRLSIDLNHIITDHNQDLPPGHPLLHVTHLDICSPVLSEWYSILPQLTNLTHLFFCEDHSMIIPNRVSEILPRLPLNLRVCILHVAVSLTPQDLVQLRCYASGETDPRIVIGAESFKGGKEGDDDDERLLIVRSFSKLLLDWSDASTDHTDLWTEAEAVMAARGSLKRRSETTKVGNEAQTVAFI